MRMVPYLSWILISPGPDNTLVTSAYRKPTHIDQYLYWTTIIFFQPDIMSITHWHIGQGWSAQMNNSNRKMNTLDKLYISVFPSMALNRLHFNLSIGITPTNYWRLTTDSITTDPTTIFSWWFPTLWDIMEGLRRLASLRHSGIFQRQQHNSHFVSDLKRKGHHLSKGWVICHFKCLLADCLEEYIYESRRTFGDRLREHLRAPSPTYHHSQATGHLVDVDCFISMDREAHGITRTIKEYMFIHVNNPSLNRNLGKYQLPTSEMSF